MFTFWGFTYVSRHMNILHLIAFDFQSVGRLYTYIFVFKLSDPQDTSIFENNNENRNFQLINSFANNVFCTFAEAI